MSDIPFVVSGSTWLTALSVSKGYRTINGKLILCEWTKNDGLVRSAKAPSSVIPAKAGIQEKQTILDPGFRRGDGFDDFLRSHQE
jgi:hypothetical protein